MCRWKVHASALAGSPGHTPPLSPTTSVRSSHHDHGALLEAEPSFAAGFAPHPKQQDAENQACAQLRATGLTVAVPTSSLISNLGHGMGLGDAAKGGGRLEEWLQGGGALSLDGFATPRASAEGRWDDEVLYDDDLLSYVSDTDYAELAALAAEVSGVGRLLDTSVLHSRICILLDIQTLQVWMAAFTKTSTIPLQKL